MGSRFAERLSQTSGREGRGEVDRVGLQASRPSSESAFKRSCHVIELTSFLQADMNGLGKYLIGKVNAYAELLESA